jgi:hypothetical protein
MQVQPDDIDELVLEVRVVGDLEGVDLPRLEAVIGPYLGDRVLAQPDPLGQRPRRPVRAAVVRRLLTGHPDDLRDRSLRQWGPAAPTLGDLPDTVHTLLGEPDPPPPDRVRADLTAAGDLLISHAVAANSNALACTTWRCGSDEEPAIRVSSARCGAVIDNAGAVITGMTLLSRAISQTAADSPTLAALIHRRTTSRPGLPDSFLFYAVWRLPRPITASTVAVTERLAGRGTRRLSR